MTRWWRKRRKPPRKKARFQIEGMTMAQVAAKVGVTARTVRYWTAERVLPAPEFRGAATRYTRQHLVCLAAIRWLQERRRMSLPAIRLHLNTASPEDVERMAIAFLPELAAAGAMPAVAATRAASTEGVTVVTDMWQRLTVLPGLEVHLHSTASTEVKALARGFVERTRGA
jgi:DNA-binding transcriptional MerR regulator